MLEQKTIMISNKEIVIQQLGGSLALKHSIILGRLFAGLAQGIESKGIAKVQDWNIDFSKMINGVISNLDPEESPVWIKQLVQQSLIKPEFTETWFDSTFSANLEGLIDLFKVILEHNYGGLLEYTRKKIEAVNISDTSSKGKKAKKPGQSTR